MIALVGGLVLAAAPSISMREAGIAGLLPKGPIPILVDVEFGDLDPAEAGGGNLRDGGVDIESCVPQRGTGGDAWHWVSPDLIVI